MTKFEKYIKFILLKAVRLSHGDNLVIWCSEKQKDFADAVYNYAYTIGGKNVEICFTDIGNIPVVSDEKIRQWKAEKYKLLWIYSDSCTAFPPLSWVTVNVATESWAKQVFPDAKNTQRATEMLWEAIYAACRIDEKDPIDNWDTHICSLTQKAEKLNGFNFKALHLKSHNGTDLHLNLIKNHRWITCTAKNNCGETIITNIPTEEVFTTPDADSVEGTVYSTKPLLYNGEKIENFWIRFADGKVAEYGAESNAHLLKELLTCRKNSNRIGEIALVPNSSPISQLGLFWYDTSFDENAGCHMAFGAAYPQTLQNYSVFTDEELDRIGFNRCDIHEDFVIDSADMEVIGITYDSQTVTVMQNGEWVI